MIEASSRRFITWTPGEKDVTVVKNSFKKLNGDQINNGILKHQRMQGLTGSSTNTTPCDSPATPPPPPPLPSQGCPPPPPPPPSNAGSLLPVRPDSAPSASDAAQKSLRCVESNSLKRKTPCPKTQMKRFQWTKIPDSRVTSTTENIWTKVATSFDGYQLNFDRMEELFSSAGQGSSPRSSFANGHLVKSRDSPGPEGGAGSLERKTKRTDEINLIDSKRSMNVNIFLHQFRMSNVDIVNCLRSGDSRKMGPERLRNLLKILPEPDDVELLSCFDGDKAMLGSAEKFYLEIIALPHHRQMTEALLMKEEFPQTIDYIKPAIDAIILSARDVKDSQALHEIMYAVLMAGNFLNSGVYSGDAAGFQLNSLLKLSELRANKPRLTLLHFVAQETEAKNPQLIAKLKELKYLAEASQYSVDSLLSDIRTLHTRVRTISTQITGVDCHFQQTMKSFLEVANGEMEVLESDVRELEELRLELAAYFCEDQTMFKLDECISIFNSFCKMFHKAVDENKERQLQDLRAEERRRLREEQIATKRQTQPLNESPIGRTREENTRTTKASEAVSGHCFDTVDFVKHQSVNGSEHSIPISQTMPSFLLESSQSDSTKDSNHGHRTRLRSRGSTSSFSKLDSRKILPETPGAEDSAAFSGQEALIDVLLKGPSSGEDGDRRPGSTRHRRRGSRVNLDLMDRERGPSPSPYNSSTPYFQSTETDSQPENTDQISRDQPCRSSCPPRISSAQARMQSNYQQQEQHPSRDLAAAADASMDNASLSDAEISAKQERENRRLERRRRSRLDSRNSIQNTEPSRFSDAPASGISDPGAPEVGSLKERTQPRLSSAQNPLRNLDNVDGKPRPTSAELDNRQIATEDFSADPSSFYADLRCRTSAPRRDAANIRSLGDQRRGSDDDADSEQPEATNQSISAGVPRLTWETDGPCIQSPPTKQDSGAKGPPKKSRLSGLIQQHNIPSQRISSVSKSGSGSQKNITKAKELQKDGNAQRKARSQSDYRLLKNSDETILRHNQETLEKWTSGELKGKYAGSNTQGAAARASGAEAKGGSPIGADEQGLHSRLQSDELAQKRMGSVFEDGKKLIESLLLSNESHRLALQLNAADVEDRNRIRIEDRKSESKALSSPLQSVVVRDYSGELRESATAVERASVRKAKLKKLSQMYSNESDDVPSRVADSHRLTDGSNDAERSLRQNASGGAAVHGQTESQAAGSYDAGSAAAAPSVCGTRDEGFDSEALSLSSASQRTSMSSTVDSDIRITPQMERKQYHGGDQGLDDGGNQADATDLLSRVSIGSVVSGVKDSKGSSTDAKHPNISSASSRKRLVEPAADKTIAKAASRIASLGQTRKTQTTPTNNRIPQKTASVSAAAAAATIKPATNTTATHYRLAKPNFVHVSAPASNDKTADGSKKKSTTSSTDKPLVSVGSVKNTKSEIKHRATPPVKQPTKVSTNNAVRMTPTLGKEKAKESVEAHPQQSAFVRGAGARVTLPADVLRENKKAANESRQVRGISSTPVPTRKLPALVNPDPRIANPSSNSSGASARRLQPTPTGLPDVEVTASLVESSASAGMSKQASAKTPASDTKSNGRQLKTTIRIGALPDASGEGRISSSASPATGSIPLPQVAKPVPSAAETKVIQVMSSTRRTPSMTETSVKSKRSLSRAIPKPIAS